MTIHNSSISCSLNASHCTMSSSPKPESLNKALPRIVHDTLNILERIFFNLPQNKHRLIVPTQSLLNHVFGPQPSFSPLIYFKLNPNTTQLHASITMDIASPLKDVGSDRACVSPDPKYQLSVIPPPRDAAPQRLSHALPRLSSPYMSFGVEADEADGFVLPVWVHQEWWSRRIRLSEVEG